MALPVLVKTWQFQVNQAVTAQANVTLCGHEVLRRIKNLLKSFGTLPWTCSGSSDARINTLPGPPVDGGTAGMDGVDRWSAALDGAGNEIMQGRPGGQRHGWIVLRQGGIAGSYEICIDLNVTSSSSCSIIASPSAGFTGGTALDRPTATDEVTLVNTTTYWSNTNVQHQIHAMQSTDGQCTRVVVFRGTTNLCTFMVADKAQDPVLNWSTPAVTTWLAAGSGLANAYATLISTSSSGTRSRGNAVNMLLVWGAEANGGAIFPNFTDIGTVANDLSTNEPLFPVALASITAGAKGRHGSLFDIWWKPSLAADADTYPNNAATRQFVVLGNLVFPWTGDATVPLLT